MFRTLARAAVVADRRVTGLSREVLADLVAELGPRWQARQEARLADRPRRRAIGAGARHRLVFVDRLLATLVHLRHGVTHDVVACWFGVSRSTITRAVGEVRPLLAERGCTVEGGLRLRTLADVVAHLGASGQVGLLDATEVRVRRPAAHQAGRQRFISGEARANTVKALVITDADGRLLFCGQTRPGSIRDLTQVRQAGLVELLALSPGVTLLADAGYQGLSAQTGGAVITPRPARRKNQIPGLPRRRRGARGRTQGSRRAADSRGARHQPPEELAGPVSILRPTRAPGDDPARGRRTGLQPGTSPTTCPISSSLKGSTGRQHPVIGPARDRSITAHC